MLTDENRYFNMLISAQEVECVDACFDGHIRGQLRLTNYRLFFSAAEGEPHDIDIPIHSMLKIDKKSQAENSYRQDKTRLLKGYLKISLNMPLIVL